VALGFLKQGADQSRALDRIAAQTRARFKLGDEAVVLVAELACTLPGCPPIDTVVVFWTVQGVRHRFKIFKPALQVTEEDLPYVWLMRSLAAPEGFDQDCC
jgi:nitrate reductase delta subunit